jgi:hypothetical protein
MDMPSETNRLQEFDIFWQKFYKNETMPGVFNRAMREIAVAAWNAAVLKSAECTLTDRDSIKCLVAI